MPVRRVTLLTSMLVAAVVLGLSVLVFRDHAPETDAPEPTAMAPPTAAPDYARLQEELRRRDETVNELRGRLAQLERRFGELAAQLESTRQESEEQEVAESDEEHGLEATQPLHEATGWLQEVLPTRFADLTQEEAFFLRELNLRGVELTDEELAHLGALANLRQLNLRGTRITGAGLRDLPFGLESLDLTDTPVKEDQLHELPDLPLLKELRLNRIPLGDPVVEVLARFPSLRHIELDGTALSDDGLRRLLQLNPRLERVEVRDSAVSATAPYDLGNAYPGLTVTR